MSLISGLILDSVRAGRAREARARQAAHVRQALGTAPVMEDMGGRAGPPATLEPGAGLLADPGSLANQLRFGGALMELPGTTAAGSAFMQGALRNAIATEEAARDRALREQLAREGLEQDQAQFVTRLTRDDMWKARADARAERSAQRAAVLGSPGTGFSAAIDPSTGAAYHFAIPGSEPHNKALQRLTTLENNLSLADELIAKVEETGTEQWGEERAKMQNMVQRLRLVLQAEQGLGAPTGADLELIEQQLADPTAWRNAGRPQTVLASLRQARRHLREIMLATREPLRRWPGMERFFQRGGVPHSYDPYGWAPPGVSSAVTGNPPSGRSGGARQSAASLEAELARLMEPGSAEDLPPWHR